VLRRCRVSAVKFEPVGGTFGHSVATYSCPSGCFSVRSRTYGSSINTCFTEMAAAGWLLIWKVSGMSLVELKALFSGLVFIIGGAGVLLPWGLGRGSRAERFMAWGNAFAGGVLGGAGLIHLLSSGVRDFRALAPGLNYPVAFVLAGASFLLMLLTEAVIVADHPDPGASRPDAGFGKAGHETGPQALSFKPHPVIYVLLVVLSIHSLIVGMALGAQGSMFETLIVFIAIVAHKASAGFALGISYRRAGCTLRRIAPVASFFSSMTPLGIMAGTAVETFIPWGGGKLFEAIFDSIGAGTFLYIASVDIVSREFQIPDDRWQKWLFAASGFTIMALVTLWI